jgi:CheY-like chemotaxis protein
MVPRVFEMFAQAGPSPGQLERGLGIGLTLVKRIVEMHGGSVQASSDGLGRGSKFVVRMPIETAAAKTIDALPSMHPAVNFRTALVVDDNVDAARSLALLLKFHGLDAHMAHDGLEAIESAERVAPDLILLDIGMPQMNGYDACRAIRSRYGAKKIKIIALTGWGQDEDRRKSKEAGFDAHLVKPVAPATLLNVLSELSKPIRQYVEA